MTMIESDGYDFDRIDQGGHNPTVYSSYAEMKQWEQNGDLPFDDTEHDSGCWNCTHFNGEACMQQWKHADPDYYDPVRDDRDPDDYCEDWDEDEDAGWEEYH